MQTVQLLFHSLQMSYHCCFYGNVLLGIQKFGFHAIKTNISKKVGVNLHMWMLGDVDLLFVLFQKFGIGCSGLESSIIQTLQFQQSHLG